MYLAPGTIGKSTTERWTVLQERTAVSNATNPMQNACPLPLPENRFLINSTLRCIMFSGLRFCIRLGSTGSH